MHRNYVEKSTQLDSKHPATLAKEKRTKEDERMVSARSVCEEGMRRKDML
jgi:hypothetical protein